MLPEIPQLAAQHFFRIRGMRFGRHGNPIMQIDVGQGPFHPQAAPYEVGGGVYDLGGHPPLDYAGQSTPAAAPPPQQGGGPATSIASRPPRVGGPYQRPPGRYL